MHDLTLSAPEPAAGPDHTPTPDLEIGRTQELASGLEAERGSVRGLFREAFDAAYDTPGDSRRGEAVQADVQMEAVTFGDSWTTQALAQGRFAAPADPSMNATLVAGLQTEPGREAVLHALKDGAPTPGLGDDVVVVLDRDAVKGLGHTGVLIGNDQSGWRLYSKDGADGGGFSGDPTWTNSVSAGQTTGPRYATFETLDSFFDNPTFSDRYEAAVRIEFEPGDNPNRGAAAGQAAERILNEDYHLMQSSCATTVEAALEGAGVPGFTITQSRATFNPFDGDARVESRVSGIVPVRQFNRAVAYDGHDDVRSASQLAWEARGRTQDDGGSSSSSSSSSSSR